MLAIYKRKANIAAGLGFTAILVALYLPDPLGATIAGLSLTTVCLVSLGDVLFLLGCWWYAKSKGHHGAWGLIVPLGFALIAACWFYTGANRGLLKWTGVTLSVVGLLVLAFLPDEHRWGS